MAAHHLAACFEHTDDPADFNADTLQEAMSHRATEGVHVASDGAISQLKKRKSESSDSGTSPKKCKVEAAFRQADGVSGKLDCIFIDGECIPLWPQYLHKTATGNFIKVDRQEAWVLQLMTKLRKSVLRGYEPHKRSEKTHRILGRLLRNFAMVC